MQASVLDNLAMSLLVLKDYSESVAAGQRTLATLLEEEETLQIEMGTVADPIYGRA
jgi:hypothetical protein